MNDSERKKTSHIEEPVVKPGNETKRDSLASLKQLQLKPLSKLGCFCFHKADVEGVMSNKDISTTKHKASFHPLTEITSQLFFKGRCLQTSQRYSTYDDKWIQPVKL